GGMVRGGSIMAERAIDGIRGTASRVTSFVGRIGRTVRRYTLITAGAATAFGTVVAKTGIGLNAQWQDAETSFKTLLGSGERARRFIEQLREEVSQGSIFRLTEAMDASRLLLGYGMSA